ncbi:hypothetical protein BIW11_06711, partial [Tropilaelaps mercedesae]
QTCIYPRLWPVPPQITSSPQVVTVPLSTLQTPLRPLVAATPTRITTSSPVPVTPERSAPTPAPVSTAGPTVSTTALPAANSGSGSGVPKSEYSCGGSTGTGGNMLNTAGSGGSSGAGSGGNSNNTSSGGGAGSNSKQQQQERARQERQERAEREKEKEKDQHEQENRNDDKQILNREKLTELVKEVDPMQQLDEEVEGVLLQLADDFIENVVSSSCLLAKHRKSQLLEAKDVSVILERQHNLYIPGFGGEDLHTYKKTSTSEAHKQRLALIRKTLKKF